MASPKGWVTKVTSRKNDVLQPKNIPTISQDYRSGDLLPTTGTTSEATLTSNKKISLIRHDITKLRVDAIVNSANNRLQNGAGVTGAIHIAAGHLLPPATAVLKGCETGSAKVTEAFSLPCSRIIHAVGPDVNVEHAKRLLRRCYRTSFELIAAHKFKTVAFSCISTGVSKFPSDEAAKAAVLELRYFFESGRAKHVDRIIFCCFEEKDVVAYQKYLPIYFPPTPSEVPARQTPSEPNEDSRSAVPPQAQTQVQSQPPRTLSGSTRSRETPRSSSRQQGTPSRGSGRESPAPPRSAAALSKSPTSTSAGRRRDEASEPAPAAVSDDKVRKGCLPCFNCMQDPINNTCGPSPVKSEKPKPKPKVKKRPGFYFQGA